MESWNQEKLGTWVANGDVELGRGDIISKDDIAEFPGPYPIYSSSAHNNGKFGEYAKYMFDEELVTWSVDGGGNFFYRPKHKFSVTNVCGYMRVKSDSLNALFVFYCLANQHSHLTFDYTTKAHPSVIRNLYWLPKIGVRVQRKIAKVLHTIDQTIEKTEALIKKYQQIKAGLMHDLFTRGIGPDGKLRLPREQAPELYQKTPIGWIPKEWSLDLFGSRIDVIDPNPSHRYPAEVQDGYPICSTENFEGDDGYNLTKSKCVPLQTYLSQYRRCNFSSTDVIFARKGKIGLARRYGADKKVFSHTVVVMKPATSGVNSEWILWLARCYWFLKGIEVTMNTNLGVPTLGVEFIKSISVPFPDVGEQKKINVSLEAAAQKVRSVSEELNKLNQIKLGLMHDLLTGKVPVKVDPHEAAHV